MTGIPNSTCLIVGSVLPTRVSSICLAIMFAVNHTVSVHVWIIFLIVLMVLGLLVFLEVKYV